MRRQGIIQFALVVLVLSLLAGCGGAGGTKDNADQAAEAEDTTPVTLTMFLTQKFTDQEFKEMLVEPLQKKYPYITLEQSTQPNIDQVLASGEIPDLITIWNGQILPYYKYGLLEDNTAMMAKHKIDLNRFEPDSLNAIRVGENEKELYGLPYTMQLNALYYNKDIFDKFGVPYPKDGMTWEDTIELAKKVSRVENGVQYRGLDYENIFRISFPLSLNYVDHKTQKPNVNTEAWKRVFELGKNILSIPNNMPKKIDSGSNDAFFKDKTVAMYATVNRFSSLGEYIENGLKVGVAQYPSYKELPNTYGLVDAHYMLITKQSKHKDAAMKVLEVLTSDEVQMVASRKFARLSPLKNPELKKQFGADMPYLKDIDFASVFKSKPAPGPIFPTIYNEARKAISDEYVKYVTDKQDVNTALRNAEKSISDLLELEKQK